MADVTISSLTINVPLGSNTIPYSTGLNTFGVPVSAIFQNTDKVGIGTTSPETVLDLVKSSDTSERAIRIQNSATNLLIGVEGVVANRFLGSKANNIFLGTTTPGAGIEFATNNTVRMAVSSNGNVGLGTETPLDKLHVIGNVISNNTPKAYVNFDGSRNSTGGAATNNADVFIRSSYNVTRVRRENNGGSYTVYFSTPSPVTNENYVVNVAAGNTANTNILPQIGNYDFNPLFTTSSFRLYFHNGSTQITPTYAHVVVHGT